MKKQIMSIAAITAIFTTGAIAFDATQGDGQLMKETGATTAVLGTYVAQAVPLVVAAIPALADAAPGELGDALIYPAFFGGNGFSTEFSVINTSSDEAIVAKVVLYSAIDSKELRDFNIYLSSNDVFRATIEGGKITSTDGSTVVVGSDQFSKTADHQYNYLDQSTMASEATPFETTVDEDIGYIAVFAMVQTDKVATDALISATPGSGLANTGYHKEHQALWRDYRHLLDQCRSQNWRDGITNGIYTGTGVVQPNIRLDGLNIVAVPALTPPASTINTCQHLSDSVLNETTGATFLAQEVIFKTPEALLTGSLTISGSDSKGTRSMLIKPTPYTNFTDPGSTQAVLWTEGELASISDRCIDFLLAPVTQAGYSYGCINADATNNLIDTTIYEFGSIESKLLVTQPWKRTIIQMEGDTSAAMPSRAAWSGTTRPTTLGRENGITAGGDGEDYNVENYGGFKITATVYNDDEDQYLATSGGFTVSPANTLAAGLIANEMSLFDPLPNGAQYPKGYASITYPQTAGGVSLLPGIVTQMTANEVDGTAEINWLYPFTN